jgi:hypothetical protein
MEAFPVRGMISRAVVGLLGGQLAAAPRVNVNVGKQQASVV